MHGMHSVSDSLSFAVCEDGELVHSLCLSPDDGIEENIGEPYDFELPYRAGEHPVEPMFSEDPYPLPFHPLELGELALRAFFGFIVEGKIEPDDIDPLDVHLHAFRVADPTGREQAERTARCSPGNRGAAHGRHTAHARRVVTFDAGRATGNRRKSLTVIMILGA
ncbi:DUF6928 family protein [Actinoplanes campanulatus]|nr:hypothetical protein Aca09nite_90800 [Actinoplanes campanulatus]